MLMWWISFLILEVSSPSLVYVQGAYTHATRTILANHLLTGYDTMARPDDKMNVTGTLIFTHMIGLDTINQVLDVAGGIVMTWTDSRLAWDTSVYNIDYIQVKINDIWAPPVTIYNAAEGRQIFSNNDDTAGEPVIIHSSGFVDWGHSLRIRSQCDVNIRFYPFDRQVCEILMIPWSYPADELLLIAHGDTINTDAYAENGEWFLSKTTAVANPFNVAGASYGTLKFTLDLERKQSYYVLNILLPVIFLAFLGPIVFVLPVESGEKAGFSLTILLSLSVVMTIVSDQIPSTSTHVASLSIYLLVTYITCVIEVLVTAFTIRLHNFHSTGHKVPATVNRLVQRFLAPLVCYRRGKGGKEDPKRVNKNKVGVRKITVQEQKDSNTILNRDRKRDIPAWRDNTVQEGEEEDDEIIDYSYEELCVMLDSFNLYVFEIITILITVISFMTISIGGSQS